MENVTARTLRAEIVKTIDVNATLMTDESVLYKQTGKMFKGHHTVNHSAGEYGRREGGVWINNNTAESFFALLKRGHYGVFHKMSKHHLFRYCNEFAFRWSHKKATDSERRDAAIRGASGKRLTYRNSAKLSGSSGVSVSGGLPSV
ncbi:transposase [Anatilimnocola floriformis]|uniref:transposase n=1 Tax=Anatilimnocola floriformis TaxID=2948575 RepID=UPI0020C3BD43|nr:transposase [Anatilimnocola floriformis]